MKVAFRVDSSFQIGTGHVHRCLNLAREFKKKKIKCHFFSQELLGNVNYLIQKEFPLHKLSIKNNLKKNNTLDANNCIKLIKKFKINLIFLDNYFLKHIWEKKVGKYCKIVFISDALNRKTFCDFFLNYNIHYENNFILKKLLKNKTKKLLGSSYSIIKNCTNFKIKNTKKIVVFMGGADNQNLTKKIVKVLSSENFNKYRKQIIIGERNRNRFEMNINNRHRGFEFFIGNKKNLYNFYKGASLVISGVGISMYEHFVFGINSIVISQNKIQETVANYHNLINIINYKKNIQNFNEKYLFKILNQKNLKEKKYLLKSLYDFKGSARIVDYFVSNDLIKTAKLVKASEKDLLFLFRLINDPEVINFSLNKKRISLHHHKKWFKHEQKNIDTKIYIYKTKYHKIGQVRFNKINKNTYLLTYSVSNEFRGKNLGYLMLKSALSKVSKEKTVIALVNKKNLPSISIFEKLGFSLDKKKEQKNFIYYFKK